VTQYQDTSVILNMQVGRLGPLRVGGNYAWVTGDEFTISASDVGATKQVRLGRREGLNHIDAIAFHQDANLSDAQLDLLFEAPVDPVLIGDVNRDGEINFSDIPSFVSILIVRGYQDEADIDENGAVEFSDIPPFVDLLIASRR